MDPVIVVDYDPHWPQMFTEYAVRVRRVLGDELILAVEHVGSTSVPGLAAKPIIDMNVVIPSEQGLTAVIELLATLGYIYEGDKGVAGRYAFEWPDGEPRHHLYVCPVDSPALREHIAFRDYLRAHPAEAALYASLKRELAVRHHDDRVAYNDGKTEFVRAVLAKVG